MDSLKQQLTTLPAAPGVYLFKDARGHVLYVGKAKLLKSRVRSYFAASADLDPAKKQMVAQITDIETIVTDTETEALILEANLIRKHQPPYNVILRDDKFYLFIKITTHEDTPRVFLTRRLKKDGARYFGPYSSAHSVRATLRLLRRIFPFRGEKESPREKIFPHPLFAQDTVSRGNLHRLPPIPPSGGTPPVAVATYNLNIENIIRFLSGQRDNIIETLRAGMQQAAKEKAFERASIFRDQLQAIERLEGSQKVYLPRRESFDVISVARSSNASAANIFAIRDGKLLNKNTFLLRHRNVTSTEDILRQFILQYYRVAQDIPKIIFIPTPLVDQAIIAGWINNQHPPRLADSSAEARAKVEASAKAGPAFTVPQRGKKRWLLKLGEVNAQQLLNQEEAKFQSDARLKEAQAELFQAIGLVSLPPSVKSKGGRIEIYDVSNIQGQLATAAMVVFEGGRPASNKYRKFRIYASGKPDDFAMLQETLRRRFAHRHQDWPQPDLIVIDGGKGQLSAARAVLKELAIDIPIISIAKREEEIFVPGRPQPYRLPFDSNALYLIQRMRDEAHRFTISYHRLLRSKHQRRSILDEIPSIGPKTKKRLLAHFGSLHAIRQARQEELTKLIGSSRANTLKDYL